MPASRARTTAARSVVPPPRSRPDPAASRLRRARRSERRSRAGRRRRPRRRPATPTYESPHDLRRIPRHREERGPCTGQAFRACAATTSRVGGREPLLSRFRRRAAMCRDGRLSVRRPRPRPAEAGLLPGRARGPSPPPPRRRRRVALVRQARRLRPRSGARVPPAATDPPGQAPARTLVRAPERRCGRSGDCRRRRDACASVRAVCGVARAARGAAGSGSSARSRPRATSRRRRKRA